MLIQSFDFDIVHRPGKSNGNADALSRRHLNAIDSAGLQTQRISEYQRRDLELADIINYLEQEQLPHGKSRARSILLSIIYSTWVKTNCCTTLTPPKNAQTKRYHSQQRV